MSKRLTAIYSLPRSGSAWLSVFLSQSGSYCYHDPLADMSFTALVDRMNARPEGHVAFIDTSLHQRELKLPPYIKTWVLLREPKYVERSLKLRGWVMNVENESSRLMKSAVGAYFIQYEDLHKLDYLESLWHSMVGPPFDRERAEYLIEMNIQRDFASVARRVCSTSA